jgi:hypothetical protein
MQANCDDFANEPILITVTRIIANATQKLKIVTMNYTHRAVMSFVHNGRGREPVGCLTHSRTLSHHS